MRMGFLDHLEEVEDHRVPGMTTYPLDEVLLTVLVGLLCRGEDFDEIEMICGEHLCWLRRFLPFRGGIAPAQTLRRVLRALDPVALEGAFAGWVASLQEKVSGVVAIDGKTLRGSRQADNPAVHMLQAFSTRLSAMVGALVVPPDSGEMVEALELIKSLPLAEGDVVSGDAAFAYGPVVKAIRAKGADYFLFVKANQPELMAEIAHAFGDHSPLKDCRGAGGCGSAN